MTANKVRKTNFFLRILLTVIAFGLGVVLTGFFGLMLLQYSVNATSLSVPDFRSQDLVSAVNLASKMGLQIEVSRVENHSDRMANQILEQDPLPGTEAKRGRKVRVVVNGQIGEAQTGGVVVAPTATQATTMSRVPDVRDLSLNEAQTLLEANGYRLGRVVEVTHEEVLKGMVISQDPPAESTLALGSQVSLLISKCGTEAAVETPPTKIVVPDLIGLKVEEARRLLAESGLSIGQIEEVDMPERNPGIIIGQIPESGQEAPAGQAMNLQVVKTIQDLKDLSLRFALPDARVPITVKVVVNDELGERVVYEEQHQGGETVEILSRTKVKGKVLIYLNGYYYWEKEL
ncbi:MAG: PASTA domain-containing protein [Candidatus Atribacteria bacterium]|nr:PASTA domain-containing protein [Candidatus Atribacteria bacterium]